MGYRLTANLSLPTTDDSRLTTKLIQTHELLAICDDLMEVLARLLVREARAQPLVYAGRLQAVDRVDRLDLVLGEGLQYVRGAGVVGRDHTVLARDVVLDELELVVAEHAEVGRAELDVVLGDEKIILRRDLVRPLGAPVGLAPAARGHQLHQAIGRRGAH